MNQTENQTGKHDSPTLGMLYILGAACGFAVMGSFVKAATQTVPVAEVIVFRSGINAIFISLLMWWGGVSFRGNNLSLLIVRAILGTTAIGFAFYATSVIPLVDVSVIIKASVFFTALVATLWLKERPQQGLYLLTVLGFIGITLIIKPTGQVIAYGGGAAFIAALLIGCISPIIRRLQETDHSLTIINTYCWMATLFYLFVFGNSFILPNSEQLFYLVGAGAVGTIAQSLFTLAYKYAPASQITPFLFSEVVFAAIFGALYFQEFPDVLTIVGAILVVASGIAIARGANRKTITEHDDY